MEILAKLATEARNPRSDAIDELSIIEMLTLINDEDGMVAAAVRTQLPQIARAVDAIAERFRSGGRLLYMGAGTSGRLGVLDASECPPTFSVSPTLVQGIIAGGDSALRHSSEHSEDSPEEGASDLSRAGFTAADALVGIAASGRTPYVLGAVAQARIAGGLTIALACVANSPLAEAAEIAISPVTGPEVLTGSTRMKAGTATKLVLNMISTGVMIRTGATFGNLMVNVQPTNAKLVDRAQRIIAAATGADEATAVRLLAEAGSPKMAIVMSKLGVSCAEAKQRLDRAGGVLRRALSANL
ncbi:MAG: N-acetylmuramic acid 6-phosphate etherase [Acidobacteriota bacterium]|nr:N-acetylmuramic acid 6-phosphate etherase [Acidobacteriota bacterium]